MWKPDVGQGFGTGEGEGNDVERNNNLAIQTRHKRFALTVEEEKYNLPSNQVSNKERT